MFIELHMIQNFAPANLNRDDTGAPKDCEFGGYRRARISSQCFKRAIRSQFEPARLIDAENCAVRTKRLVEELVGCLTANGKDGAEAAAAAATLLKGIGLGVGEDAQTQYLLFLGRQEIDALAGVMLENWDALMAASSTEEPPDGQPTRGRTRKTKKKQAGFPDDLKTQVLALLDGGKAADLALFGRMLADLPEKNIDAACQVAHAISTHNVEIEFDFYTAVDDLRPREETGAGMMGTVEFNSACFYRYADINLIQLVKNLSGDRKLARATVEAFLRAAVAAIPTGKQNSMAAQNPPDFVMAVVRPAGLWSLAGAFVKPVRPDGRRDLVENSVERLAAYWGRLNTVYGPANGDASAIQSWYIKTFDDPQDIEGLGKRQENLDSLVKEVLAAIAGEKEEGR